MLLNTPPIPLLIDDNFILKEPKGFTRAQMIAVETIPGRPLFFTVHLENGALYSRLPLCALKTDRYDHTSLTTSPAAHVAQPFPCLEDPSELVLYTTMKDASVKILTLNQEGTYLFTINYQGEGFAQDPEQHKTHNIIALDNGYLCALPNNHLLFLDNYFTINKNATPPQLKRNNVYWSTP